MAKTMMRAIRVHEYGGPENLVMETVERPEAATPLVLTHQANCIVTKRAQEAGLPETTPRDLRRTLTAHLMDHGIDKSRLTYKGYGLTMPIDTNDTDEGRANNRRTEFKVLAY